MWICVNDGFVSIVEDYHIPGNVLVRGRRHKDVNNFVHGQKPITKTPNNDYHYRTTITKFELIGFLVNAVEKINYTNFKNSTKDKVLHGFYNDVWYVGQINLNPDYKLLLT